MQCSAVQCDCEREGGRGERRHRGLRRRHSRSNRRCYFASIRRAFSISHRERGGRAGVRTEEGGGRVSIEREQETMGRNRARLPLP